MKISVVCPFYNEELILDKAIEGMLQNLKSLPYDWELVIVNDGSLDGSLAIAQKWEAREPKLKVVTYPINQGRGHALKAGINAAAGDIIITTEIDLSWGDDIVHKLAGELANNPKIDFVVASPNIPGGGYKNVPAKRVSISRLGNRILGMLFSGRFTMNTGMTRGYRRDVIQPLNIREKGKEFHLEVLLKLTALGFKSSEVPAVLEWKDHKLSKDTGQKKKILQQNSTADCLPFAVCHHGKSYSLLLGCCCHQLHFGLWLHYQRRYPLSVPPGRHLYSFNGPFSSDLRNDVLRFWNCSRSKSLCDGRVVVGGLAKTSKINNSLQIYYISSSSIPSRTANSIHVIRMCQSFARNGHKVILFAQFGNIPSLKDDEFYGFEREMEIVKLHRPPIRIIGPLLFAARMVSAVKRKGYPDLFYGRFVYALMMLASMGIPFIFESHAPPRNFLQKWIERHLFKSKAFKSLVVISEALKDIYLGVFPELHESKIIVAHDGANLPDSLEPRSIIWPGRPGHLQAGYIGHLYPGRGIDVIANLAEKVANVDFHIIGGTDEDIAIWKTRSRFDNMIFHGFVPHAQLTQYFAHLDVMLAPYQNKVTTAGSGGDTSRWMSPLKLFEYMAHAKPIICSDIRVLREVITPEFNALMADPTDINQWENALNRLRDASLRKQLGLNGQRSIHKKYSWDNRAKNVLAQTKML